MDFIPTKLNIGTFITPYVMHKPQMSKSPPRTKVETTREETCMNGSDVGWIALVQMSKWLPQERKYGEWQQWLLALDFALGLGLGSTWP